ncbi:MAG: ATP-binding protein [Gemmatimonadaceae bacterium]
MRWVYVGRLSVAAAIFLAALVVWSDATPADTFIAALACSGTVAFTAASAAYTELQRRDVSTTFYYLQAVFDLLLVTSVVHLTGGRESQFSALYILVIASASVLLPVGGGLLVAALGNVLYIADVLWGGRATADIHVWMQLGVFAIVALGSAYVSARLQEAGEGKEELVAELTKVRLQAADILRNIRSGIVTVDGDGRLVYANPAAGTLLDLPLDLHFGKSVAELLATRAPELARVLIRSAHDGARTIRAETTIETSSRRFPIGVTTTYMASDQDRVNATATAIFQDISDQKRIDTLRVRAERLEAVAELSASLAHEIKNPLASIRSAVEQLGQSPKARDDDRLLSILIVRESDRLSRLLSEFLDFARARVTRIQPLDVGAVVRGATDLVRAHPDCRPGITVVCDLPTEPLTVDGDDDLLHRAIFNLTLNAVQALPERGTVRVDLAALPDADLPDGVHFETGAVAIRVSDDGPGIPAEIRSRLFTPFSTTKPGGTGLGLPVVHRAIEAHRGLVFVDSGSTGTRFTIILPRALSPATSGAHP